MRTKLAEIEQIPEGKALIVRGLKGQAIALFNINGTIFALDNACPHQGASLGEGTLEDSMVTCPWHAWQFNVRTGECLNMPGEDATIIPISIEKGVIYLEEA